MSNNNKISEKEIDLLILNLVKLHSQEIELNSEEFLDLLKHSLSLNLMEKKRVVDAVPTLSQFQFNELIKVFKWEREQFAELAKKHPDDIKKLVKKQQEEWTQLWELYDLELKNKVKEDENKNKIDDIKASLWL